MREKIISHLKAIKPTILLTAVACFIFALVTDIASKTWALSALAAGKKISLVSGWLDLELTANAGAALSLGSGQTWRVTIFSLIFTLILAGFLIFSCSRWDAGILLGIVLGGAVGNLHDRFLRPPGGGNGAVVDFINYHGWFVGNVADIYIVAGLLIFVISTFLFPSAPKTLADSEVTAASVEGEVAQDKTYAKENAEELSQTRETIDD